MLPDALQDVERKMDVQVTQEHDAVAILEEEAETRVSMAWRQFGSLQEQNFFFFFDLMGSGGRDGTLSSI